jgi:ketosteroid isomerase-like protein
MKRYAGFALVALGAAASVAFTLRKRRSPEDVVRDYFAAWESGDPKKLEAVVAGDYAGHVKALAGTEDRDHAALADALQAHTETFTESSFDIEDLVQHGGKVAARVRLSAVHGDDAREVELEGLVFLRVAGGRIAEEWANWDYLDLAQQLGVELELTPPA